jgi:hypothetical protein
MPNLFRHLIRMARVKKCYASEILKQVQDDATVIIFLLRHAEINLALRWGYTNKQTPQIEFSQGLSQRTLRGYEQGLLLYIFTQGPLRETLLRQQALPWFVRNDMGLSFAGSSVRTFAETTKAPLVINEQGFYFYLFPFRGLGAGLNKQTPQIPSARLRASCPMLPHGQ